MEAAQTVSQILSADGVDQEIDVQNQLLIIGKYSTILNSWHTGLTNK